MTPEEATIKAAIEARIVVLRDQVAFLEREAAAHERSARMKATEALRLSGGIDELAALASGIVSMDPYQSPEAVYVPQANGLTAEKREA
jgi:hypothetical protein